MNRRQWVPAAIALTVVLAASSAAPASERAAGEPGEIVFTSDRATANPGEIYALAPGAARRNLSRSPHADVGLAVSPKGRAYAFWSNRTGPWRLMVSADGRTLRSVPVGGPKGLDYPSAPPVFSADGTQLVIPYLALDSITQLPEYALAGVRSGPAKRLATRCRSTPALSPDGKRMACEAFDGDRIVVADLRGRVRFTVPGNAALWSPDGRVAVTTAKTTEVLSPAGRSVASLTGVARAWSGDGRTLALTRPGALVLARPGVDRVSHVVYRDGGGEPPYWVAFTPDGRTIAFAGGLGVAQMAAVAGGRVRPFAGQPFGSWSRDGRYSFLVAASGMVRIEIGDQFGRKARVVARLPYDGKGVSRLAWLGDGSAVLYNGSAPIRADLWRMRADGSGQRRLTGSFPIAEPTWSADGTQLAYRRDGLASDGGVAVAGADGRRRTAVSGARPAERSNDGNPSWSPDASRIAVADVISGGISVVDVAGGSRSSVAVDGVSPAWSPDGATIAFVDLDDGTVWGATPTGADRHRLLPASVRKVTSIAWSPDGKRLAFSTRSGISIAVPDGVSAPRVVTAARAPGRPSFSPDGLRIAFAAAVGRAHTYRAVSVAGVDGSGRRQLTSGPYDSSDPAWRPATP